jgi:hypothetical protein
MAPECQKKNLKGLTLVAVGVNKSAEQYLLLDEETRDDLARGKYHDQRRASFGTSVPAATPAPSAELAPSTGSAPSAELAPSTGSAPSAEPAPSAGLASSAGAAPVRPVRPSVPAPRRPAPARPAPSRPAPRRPWSRSQEKLALLYNEQGRRPDEIAEKLGLTSYLVTQIILTTRNRGKL